MSDQITYEGNIARVAGCLRITPEGVEEVDEVVASEVPVACSFNGVVFNVAHCSPADLEDLACGIAFSNGFITSAADVASVEVTEGAYSWDVNVRLRDGIRVDPGAFKLSPLSSVRLEKVGTQLGVYYPAMAKNAVEADPIPASAIHAASQNLFNHQDMHQSTGATHASAFVDRTGGFLLLREDVGRHNALDKLIGAMIRQGTDPSEGFLFLSSRCALELLSKAVRYRFGVVATVSAPTSAVIELADESGVTLCSFARKGRFTIYTHPERVIW